MFLFITSILLAFTLLPPVSADTTATPAPETCQPGSFIYNMSGTYICVPALQNITALGVIISAWASPGTLEYNVACTNPSGCNIEVEVVTGNNTPVYAASHTLANGGVVGGNTSIPASEKYMVVKVTDLSNPNNPPLIFAVPVPLTSGTLYSTITSTGDRFLSVILGLLIAAPPLGFLLTGRSRMSGVALLIIAVPYGYIVSAIGAPGGVAVLLTTTIAVVGIILIATGKAGE